MNGRIAKALRKAACCNNEDKEYGLVYHYAGVAKMPITSIPTEGGRQMIGGRIYDFDDAEMDKSQTNKLVPMYSLTSVLKGNYGLYKKAKKDYKERRMSCMY